MCESKNLRSKYIYPFPMLFHKCADSIKFLEKSHVYASWKKKKNDPWYCNRLTAIADLNVIDTMSDI